MLKVSLFRHWDFTFIFVCLMLINMFFMGLLYLVPFYGEICLGKSSLDIGLFLFASAIVTAVLGLPMGKWSDRVGRKAFCVFAGLFATAAAATLGVFTNEMSDLVLLSVMCLLGLSWACVGGPMASRLVEHAGDERDMAASLTNEAYYVGGAIGTALIAMAFTIFAGADGIGIEDLSADVFAQGFTASAWILAALALIISLMSFVVKDE